MSKINICFLALILSCKLSAQWSTIYNTSSDFFYCIKFLDKDIGYCSGVGEIMRTNDGGNTWTQQYNSNVSVECMFFHNKDTGYAVGGTYMGSAGLVLKTVNGGATWATQTNSVTAPLYSVYFPALDTGYAVGLNGVIVKTVDGGQNWVPQNSPTTLWNTCVYFTGTNTGYIASYGGQILKTTDGGVNWLPLSSGTTDHLLGIKFTSASVGYACGGSSTTGIILKTTDAGTSWSLFNAPATAPNLHTFSFLNASKGLCVGENGSILYTTNAGATWAQQSSGLTSRLFYVSFPVQDTAYACGEYKKILKSTALITGLNEIAAEPGVRVFPNPANGVFSVECLTEAQQDLPYLADITGRIIEVGKPANISNGKLTYTFNQQATLAPGVYLVVVKGNTFTSTIQVIVGQ